MRVRVARMTVLCTVLVEKAVLVTVTRLRACNKKRFWLVSGALLWKKEGGHGNIVLTHQDNSN